MEPITSRRFPRTCVNRVGLCLASVLVIGVVSTSRADEMLTDARFNLAILEPISATVQRSEVRSFLQRVTHDRKIAILLDCRIDPHQLRDVAWVDLSLFEAIESLAADIDASAVIVGDTFVVGPTDSLRNLRTLVELRFAELERLSEVDRQHVARLRRRTALAWHDLDRPDEMLQSIAAAAGLRIENPELIPHDLWAGATIANANAVEQLSIVLMQLDLAFVWDDGGTAITLVPYPVEVTITREHQPRRMSLEEAEAAATAEFPGLPMETLGRALSVTGRVEEHERIEELLGIRQPRQSMPNAAVPLARRTFTLTVVNQPVGAVLQALVDQGVPIDFDADALTAAGANLTVKVSLQLRDARIEGLMDELCGPAGLSYEVEGERVLLSVD